MTKIKSTIGQSKKVRMVLDSMGLRKIGSTRVYQDNNCIRGMVNKVAHLVNYELIQK